MTIINEETVELQSIEWFKELGFQYKNGYDISPDGNSSERDNHRKVILQERLRSSIIKINSEIPSKNINNAINQILNPNIPDLHNCNRMIHSWLTKGLKITYLSRVLYRFVKY